ncbi:hypothetical protein Trihar35433_2393 [Trichoderma harzianum]|nr:hypothetical protein Trihar35433_2393 [Trichoderma harzianum]
MMYMYTCSVLRGPGTGTRVYSYWTVPYPAWFSSEGAGRYRALGPLRPTSRREPTINAFPQPCSQSFSLLNAQRRGGARSWNLAILLPLPKHLRSSSASLASVKPSFASSEFSEAIRFQNFLRYLCHEHDVDLPLVGTK